MTYSALQLAEAFLQTGEYTDALDALNAHLTDQPDDEYARRLRAALLLRLADGANHDYLQQAEADLAHLPALTPQDWQTRASIAEQLGNAEQAIAYLLQSSYVALTAEINKDPRLVERLLKLYMRQKRFDEALALVRQQKRTWQWLQWEGDLLAEQGNFVDAITCYENTIQNLEARFGRAGDAVPGNSLIAVLAQRITLVQAHAARHAQQYALAENLYQRVQHSQHDLTITFNLGILRALQGDLPKAVELCREALAKEQNDILKAEMLRELDSPEFGALKQAVLA